MRPSEFYILVAALMWLAACIIVLGDRGPR
jgi:hypothetical protein